MTMVTKTTTTTSVVIWEVSDKHLKPTTKHNIRTSTTKLFTLWSQPNHFDVVVNVVVDIVDIIDIVIVVLTFLAVHIGFSSRGKLNPDIY